MKPFGKYFLLAAFALGNVEGMKAQTLEWPAESIQTKPGARWWWLGNAVDNGNLEYLMGEYSRVGIGTLEITPIYGVQAKYQNGHKPITFLSNNWFNAFKYVQSLGEKNSIQIDMNMGTGWPFGGPGVTLQEAAGKLVYTNKDFTTNADAPTITYDVTPVANSELNKVMAYPRTIKDENGVNITKTIQPVDVTEYVGKNTLVWTPELAGTWRIIAVFNGHTMQMVKRPAPGGEGYVMDHLDSAAVANYIKNFEDKFDAAGNPYPATFFNDSYEIFGADWSPRFFEEFEKRRGYKLQDHLQELFNLATDTYNGVANQIRSDYRETMADMYLDNFIKPWNDFCHRHGVMTRNQSHGSPSNLVDTYASVDIPEIEGYGMTPLNIKGLRKDNGFTAVNSSDFATLKLASSAAHVTGKPLTSSETFTWFTEHFRTSLSQMKPEMDLMFLAGVNRMFFHGTTYSPQDAAWPGWKFYASIDMSPTNSIWADAPEFMKYVSRCQSFLQMGKPDNDILVYFTCQNSWHTKGTNWLKLCAISDFASQYQKLDRAVDSLDVYGYGTDYITDDMIRKLKYEDGEFVTEGGARYKAMQIPVAANMPADVKQILDSLQAKGANIISEKRDEVLFNNVCKAEPMRRELGLRYIRRKNDTGHHYFISNLTDKDVADYVGLAVDFESAALYNPVDGSIKKALVKDGKVFMDLKSGESVILQVFDTDIPSADVAEDRDLRFVSEEQINLNGAWTLTLGEKNYTLKSLQSWESLDDYAAEFMGTGMYETNVNVSKEQMDNADDMILDLGDVRESAKVYVNDEYVGTAWCVPFCMSIKKAMKVGDNKICVAVTNLPANKIRKMDKDNVTWRIFDDINISTISSSNGVGTTPDSFAGWALAESGLNGNVSIRSLLKSEGSGIHSVSASDSSSDSRWFTIQGVEVSGPDKPGVYVNSGRKYIISK